MKTKTGNEALHHIDNKQIQTSGICQEAKMEINIQSPRQFIILRYIRIVAYISTRIPAHEAYAHGTCQMISSIEEQPLGSSVTLLSGGQISGGHERATNAIREGRMSHID